MAKLQGMFLIIMVLAMLNACAPVNYKSENSVGFLSDYTQLKPVDGLSGASAWRWRSANFATKNYDKVAISSLVFYPQPKTKDQVSAAALEDIRKSVESTLLKTVEKSGLPMASKGGERVLTLRSAITSVSVELKDFSVREVIPVRLVFSGAEMALGKRDKEFSLLFEYELLDSQSGEVMYRGIRQDRGNPLVNDQDNLSLEHARPILQRLVKDLEQDMTVLAIDLMDH